MDIASLGLHQPSTASSAAGIAATGLADNFDTFLKLLTEQLKNQDPLEPMEAEKFTEQLVQFSGVEQQIKTNDNLETSNALAFANQQGNMVGYIGKTVDVSGNRAQLSDNKAIWGYELDAEAAEVSVAVTDATGKVVFTGSGPTEQGLNTVNWDGKDNAGNQMPDGLYQLSAAAKDAEGDPLELRMRMTGQVEAVEIVDGVARLIVQGAPVNLNDVTVVTQ